MEEYSTHDVCGATAGLRFCNCIDWTDPPAPALGCSFRVDRLWRTVGNFVAAERLALLTAPLKSGIRFVRSHPPPRRRRSWSSHPLPNRRIRFAPLRCPTMRRTNAASSVHGCTIGGAPFPFWRVAGAGEGSPSLLRGYAGTAEAGWCSGRHDMDRGTVPFYVRKCRLWRPDPASTRHKFRSFGCRRKKHAASIRLLPAGWNPSHTGTL